MLVTHTVEDGVHMSREPTGKPGAVRNWAWDSFRSFNAWKFRAHKYKTENCSAQKPGPGCLLKVTRILGKDIVTCWRHFFHPLLYSQDDMFCVIVKRMLQATGTGRGGTLHNQPRVPSPPPPLSIPFFFFF